MESALTDTKEQIHRIIVDDTSFTREDLWHLYWMTDVNAKYIAERLGMAAHLALRPGPVGACPHCGASVNAFSRATLNPICEACKATQLRKVKATWAQQEAERRAQGTAARRRLRELRAMPYRDYLRTPEWQGVRLAALRRAKYSCQLCNASGVQLHVHHRTYQRRGQEWDSDVIVLCKACHEVHHGILAA